MSGITGTQSELLYALTSAITKNTYTTEAAFTGVLGTNTVCKIPGNWANNDVPNPIGRSLLLKVWGSIANVTAATFAVNLGLDAVAGTKGGAGGGSIGVYAATAPTASITAPWYCQVELEIVAFATSTMTLQVNGFWRQEAVASGGVLSASAQCVGFRGSVASIDPTKDLFLELFGTWSASSASNTTTVDQMKLYGEN